MDSASGDHVNYQLTQEARSALVEGISLIFSRWTVLQIAIENGWGGGDSRKKSEQLASDILAWFSRLKGPHYIDDLENLIDEFMLLSFELDADDGSIEEVAEQIMIIHEGCLQGNYESIEKLRKTNLGSKAVSQSRQVVNEDDDDSSEDEASDMMVDEPKPKLNGMPEDVTKDAKLNGTPKDVTKDAQKSGETVEDGWVVVSHKRNKGKRN